MSIETDKIKVTPEAFADIVNIPESTVRRYISQGVFTLNSEGLLPFMASVRAFAHREIGIIYKVQNLIRTLRESGPKTVTAEDLAGYFEMSVGDVLDYSLAGVFHPDETGEFQLLRALSDGAQLMDTLLRFGGDAA